MRSAHCAAMLGIALITALAATPATAEETPKHGGILTYMIPADAPPSFDGHRETTYATVHSTAPFYSVLIRLDPEQSGGHHQVRLRPVHRDSAADRRRQDLHLQDPQRREVARWLAAHRGRCRGELEPHHPSAARATTARGRTGTTMVDTISAPDPTTVVFHLKYATLTFLPALADPYSYIYKKDILDKDPNWYQKNIMGSGPFKFVDYQLGQSIKGERNPDYYHKGLPYLDGFVGIFADKQVVRTEAIRADRAATEFRGLPPAAIDQLKQELGDKITIQQSDWNCGNLITPNSKKKPFDDVRVRKALLLAIDQWHGAPALSKIADVKTVGGIVFPGSPLAATKDELQKMAGFWPDIDKSRAEAKQLAEGGGPGEPQLRDAEP